MPLTLPKPRRWNVDEYHRLADYGFFQDQRVELVGGRILEMAPRRDLHAAGILIGRDTLAAAFGGRFVVRPQLPLRLSETSEPEPDLAVVMGGPRDFVGKGHPSTALLVVEISDATLAYDRRRKAGAYARAGIADYWIVNLVDRQIEVLRQPITDSGHPFGHRYFEANLFKPSQSITTLARADVVVSVDDMLP